MSKFKKYPMVLQSGKWCCPIVIVSASACIY